MPTEGEEALIDPVTAAAGKAIQSATEGLSKAAGELLVRVFGRAADQIGLYLEQKAYYRFNNAQRIAEKAQRKAEKLGREDGIVAPRLAYTMLEDGTYSDDELMAEYLGGVLAAGRTPAGKDDRGVTWTKVITTMSALQIRAHFILYREWAIALHGSGFSLNMDDGRNRAVMYVDLSDFVSLLLETDPDVDAESALTHVLSNLHRLNLIEGAYRYGSPGPGGGDRPVFEARPSLAGMELYGWACGLSGVTPSQFITAPELVQVEEIEVARPRAVLPGIPATADTPAQQPSE
ncbi:hypothetical protein Mycsm_04292 [Mycobacterium sp. JS623]|uniref:hypothetical protein n=1 Tax=Mycobacterium sp. JS623 TaxID=212767 RepID=UPI0002A5BB1B|nr:hypothetical protein [Mycobacterium sp. JS623]AGB24540.1 hypothetical protein Mycsm_04292 [Mycobacterium sp. JS623]